MLDKKKLLIIIFSIILLCAIICVILILLPKNNENIVEDVKEEFKNTNETVELESKLTKIFSNVDYSQNNEDIVRNIYKYEKTVEDKYEVKVYLPKINIDTCADINTEILQLFGDKLKDIVNNSNENIKYKVDYISYINKNVISLVIKCELKEGDKPQRAIIKTYNYDVNNEKLLKLEDMIEFKELNKDDVQNKIKTKIKEKIISTNEVINKGYNIYERDFNSEEYLIENIENFFFDEEENLFVIFPYGNSNFTEETDVIVFK